MPRPRRQCFHADAELHVRGILEDGKPTPATLQPHAAAIGLTRQEARDA